MGESTDTSAAKLKLAADTFIEAEQLDPTRNLDKDLEMTNPAQKRRTHPTYPNSVERPRKEDNEDTAMGTPGQYLRGSPERSAGSSTREELRVLTAQVEGLKMADKENRRAIKILQQNQEKLSDTAKNVEKIDAVVQEN